MKKTASILALFVALLFGLLACSKGSSSGASGKLKVVTTNSILADITKNIAEDKIDLHSIVPVGQRSSRIRTASRRCQKDFASRPHLLQRDQPRNRWQCLVY